VFPGLPYRKWRPVAGETRVPSAQRRRRNYAVGEIRNRFTRHFHHFHSNPPGSWSERRIWLDVLLDWLSPHSGVRLPTRFRPIGRKRGGIPVTNTGYRKAAENIARKLGIHALRGERPAFPPEQLEMLKELD
jgi:hypothetical protein